MKHVFGELVTVATVIYIAQFEGKLPVAQIFKTDFVKQNGRVCWLLERFCRANRIAGEGCFTAKSCKVICVGGISGTLLRLVLVMLFKQIEEDIFYENQAAPGYPEVLIPVATNRLQLYSVLNNIVSGVEP